MIDKRYLYAGDAAGAAARITRIDETDNLDHTVPTLAPSSLSIHGGFSEGKVEHYCFDVDTPRKLNILSAKHVSTRAEGKPHGDGHRTQVDAVLHGFSVLEQVHIDLIKARLVTTHGANDHVPIIRPEGNRLEGLRLGDHGLKVVLDEELFCECPTKDALAGRFASDEELQNRYAWRFNADPGSTRIPEYKRVYVCSLVREIQWTGAPHPDVTIEGYTLRWRGFGRIYLGEIVVGDHRRRLTMVRMKMGSPVDGDASGGSVGSGGAGLP